MLKNLNVDHLDISISMDIEKCELRPSHHMDNTNLIESASVLGSSTAMTDAIRTTNGYQKTGDLITLPYTQTTHTENPYATRTEKVQPVMTSQWVGLIQLTPSGDEWFETEQAPTLVINVDGNYDAVLAANENQIGGMHGKHNGLVLYQEEQQDKIQVLK